MFSVQQGELCAKEAIKKNLFDELFAATPAPVDKTEKNGKEGEKEEDKGEEQPEKEKVKEKEKDDGKEESNKSADTEEVGTANFDYNNDSHPAILCLFIMHHTKSNHIFKLTTHVWKNCEL